MRRGLLILCCCLFSAGCAADAVTFINASKPTRCAEEDNVYVKLQAAGIARFGISAEHPPYIDSVREDSTAPDFSHCDMSQDPVFHFTPRRVVLYEDAVIRVVGHTYATFWRPDIVDFRIGERVERGLHLVQLLKRGVNNSANNNDNANRDIEILVVYPADGYWRPKPLPPAALADSAYGSSFLFGPIEESTRPYVAIRAISFDPATLAFRLDFKNGSRGTLTVTGATRAATRLALSLDPPPAATQPFAALRSMFVTPAQADVALAAWQDATGARSLPVLEFSRFDAAAARFGRRTPSRHNLSAPDVVFENFSSALNPAPPAPETHVH